MKILHVAETAKGGVGVVIDSLVQRQLAMLGDNAVHVLVPNSHRDVLHNTPDRVVSTWRRVGRGPADLGRFAAALARLRARIAPDVIHLHSTFAGLIGRVAHGGSALVYSPHGWAFEMWPSGRKREVAALVERTLARRAQRIITVSDAERRQALAAGIPDHLINVVVNGLSPEAPDVPAAKWEDRRRKLLFVGRLDRQKGLDLLLPIVARHPDRMCLRVCGASVVGSDAAPVAPPDNVELLGWLSAEQIEAQIRAADALVVPSRWEALSLSAVEAMRAGKPVIAFAVGGLAEVVKDGVTGRSLAAGDVDGLERALLTVENEDLRRWGTAGRQRFVEHYTADRMATETLAVYRAAQA